MKFSIVALCIFLCGSAMAQVRYSGERNRKGEPHGKGTMTWADTTILSLDSITFSGVFKKGIPYKSGEIRGFKDGKIDYEGIAEIILEEPKPGTTRPLIHGYAKIKFGAGDVSYEGMMSRGQFHGHGVHIDKEGVKRSGTWEHGKPVNMKTSYPGDDWSVSHTNIPAPPHDYKGLEVGHTIGLSSIERFFLQAVKNNETEKAIQFLKRGAVPKLYRDGDIMVNPLYHCIEHKNTVLMDAILAVEPLLAVYSQAIHFACAHSDSTMIDYLISKGANLELNGYVSVHNEYYNKYLPIDAWNGDCRYELSPMDVALASGNFANFDYLAKKNMKPTSYGLVRALVWAIEKDIEGITDYFLDVLSKGILPKPYLNQIYPKLRTTPLIEAVKKGNKDLVKRLLDLGADPNGHIKITHSSISELNFFSNPLYEAVKGFNMKEIIQMLLDHGATPYKDILQSARSEYQEYFILQGLM